MKPRNLHIIIVAACLGTIIWLTVSLREQYQIAIDVPISIDGVPSGSAIRSPVPPTVHVKLRGDGWRLATLLMGPEVHLALPLESLTSGRRAVLMNELADRFAARPGIEIMDCDPETLSVDIDRRSKKSVPVAIDCSLSFDNGYGQVGRTSVVPESVSVSGAESIVRSIDAWRTDHRTFESLRSSVDEEIPLATSSPYQLAIRPAKVRVHVSVEPFAEQTFTGLTVQLLSAPADREVVFVPPKLDITVRGGIKQLAALSAADFRVTTDYSVIMTDTTGSIEPRIATPAGVQIVGVRPDRLTYIIRKPS